jgi:hypothetical protein
VDDGGRSVISKCWSCFRTSTAVEGPEGQPGQSSCAVWGRVDTLARLSLCGPFWYGVPLTSGNKRGSPDWLRHAEVLCPLCITTPLFGWSDLQSTLYGSLIGQPSRLDHGTVHLLCASAVKLIQSIGRNVKISWVRGTEGSSTPFRTFKAFPIPLQITSIAFASVDIFFGPDDVSNREYC